MTIEATIIADSISPDGIRLTTMQLRYPRFIHAELMTHRVFSRNASSSRAIPVEKVIADLRRDPAMPVYWGANQKGMQAASELTPAKRERCRTIWLNARDAAISHAQDLMDAGLHKQIANRILEPWSHINVVITATEWDNFYALRRHPDAQPEIQALADAMHAVHLASTPKELLPGEWHLPYVTQGELQESDGWDPLTLIMVSVARCARVSYLTHDGRATTIEEDIALYDRLVGSVPLHASPAEHQATPDVYLGPGYHRGRIEFRQFQSAHEHGNFVGWRQFRKILEAETSQNVAAT